MPAIRAAAAAPWATEAGMSFGPWHTPATNTPSVIVATGSSFGWRSVYQPAMLHEMPHFRPISLASVCGSIAPISTTISTGMRRCLPSSVSSTWTIELALSGGLAGGVGHFGDLAADEMHRLPPAAVDRTPRSPSSESACRCRTSTPRPWSFPGPGVRTSAPPCSRPTSNRDCVLASRLPTQWMIATDFGSVLPSRRTILPLVGPAALQSRSNSRFVKTLGSRP